MVRFENVGLRYGLGPEILRDLSFLIPAHSFQFLTGPSGAGKTSLLRLLFLSLRPTRGLVNLFGQDISMLGKEQVEGTDVYKLKTTKKDGSVTVQYIDAEHFLLIKQEAKRTVRGTEMEIDTIVGDYKDVGGLMMAHSIDGGAKGAPMRQKLTIEKIEVNVPIDDARFRMPAAK